ncbi:MAG: carboxypeptidase-like regulatory domain-containing protein [Planctomycetaceae bacterium]|nr:carboxypeptidase-like regulatory domain-containing protein [Planctomycetaceae bacterium]
MTKNGHHKKSKAWIVAATMGVTGLIVVPLFAAISSFWKDRPIGFLNLDAFPERVVRAEKNSTVLDGCDQVVYTMSRVTGRKWSRGGSFLNIKNLNIKNTKNAPVTDQIRVCTASRPLFSGKSWYRITVTDGILIEAATKQGFLQAAEHFAELIRFEGNRPQMARGEYTARDRKKELTQEEIMNLTAIRQDADKVTITGMVKFPNGHPAADVIVDIHDFNIFRDSNQGTFFYGAGCATSIPGGYPCKTDGGGKFEFEAIPGCILVVGVTKNPVDGHLVSDMVCMTPSYHSNPPLNLTLRKGVPVTLRVRHDDGTPAEGVRVAWKRSFPPPVNTYNDSNIDNNCNAQDSVTPQNGETTFYLSPGEYELSVSSDSHLAFETPKTITVAEGGHDVFDFTIPKPVTVRLLQVNGDPLANHRVKLLHVGSTFPSPQPRPNVVDVQTDADGMLTVYLWDEANYIFAMSEDERFCIVKPLSPDDAGKTLDVPLEHATRISLLVNTSDTPLHPVANMELQCQIEIATLGSFKYSHPAFVNKFKTDNRGFARFSLPSLPPGDAYLQYMPLLGTELNVPKTDSSISLHISAQGDFSDYRPKYEPPDSGQTNAAPSRIVEVRGRVTYPDGTPGGNLLLYTSQCSQTGGVMSVNETDSDGYYSTKVPEDGFFAALVLPHQGRVNDVNRSLGFASPVMSVYVGKSAPDVLERGIALQDGVPLRGRLTFENGEPAAGKNVTATAYPFGRNTIWYGDGGGTLNLTFGSESDENGEYVILLTPGEYVVSQFSLFGDDRRRDITIRPDDEECVLDFVLPAETTATVLLPDGTPAVKAKLWYNTFVEESSASSNQGQKETDADGNFSLPLTPFGNMLLIYTEDKSLGLVKTITGDERLEHHTLTLQPPEIGKVRFISQATGKPIAGIKIRYSTQMERENGIIGGMPLFAETDNEGYAELQHLFIGGTYGLHFHFEPSRRTSPAITKTLTPAQPGETVDYGEIVIHGDFADYEPE